MNQATLRALKGSIKKWKRIVDKAGQDLGGDNCPLCEISNAYCDNCPVYKKTGKYDCGETPYIKWIIHHREVHANSKSPHTIQCKICKRHAKAEVEFLKSLLPEGHNETSKKSKP